MESPLATRLGSGCLCRTRRTLATPRCRTARPRRRGRARDGSRRERDAARWEETGHGQPLILLHGLSGDDDFWQPHLPALSADFRVIAIAGLGGHELHQTATRSRTSPTTCPRCWTTPVSIRLTSSAYGRVRGAVLCAASPLQGRSAGARSDVRAIERPDQHVRRRCAHDV